MVASADSRGNSMRRGVLGYLAVSALLLAAPWSAAHAADMALKARPAAAAAAPLPYNWTGFYVGVLPPSTAAALR